MGRTAEEHELVLLRRPIGVPRHRWIYEALRDLILKGRLKSGARLPTTRDFARQHEVARGTVVTAYDQLAAEGYIECTIGRGTFVARTVPDDLLTVNDRGGQSPRPGAKAIKLSQRGLLLGSTPFPIEPQFEPAPRAFRASMPDVAAFPVNLWAKIYREQLVTDRSLLYNIDAAGYYPLREVIATYVASARGISTTPENIVIISSIQQALDLLARLLLNPNDHVWVEDPGYLGGRAVLIATGAKITGVPVDKQGLDVAAGKRLAPHAKIAYVTACRHAPLGVSLSLSRQLELLRWARERQAFIVEDDYDSEYRFHGKPLAALKSLDYDERVIFAGTFSKLMFPSLRLGYVILPSALVQPFVSALSVTARYVSSGTQAALHKFITDGHLWRHIRRMRLRYAERADALQTAAHTHWRGHLSLPPIEAGLDVTAHLPAGVDDKKIANAAAKAGIIVLPLSRYAIRPIASGGLVLGFAAIAPTSIRRASKVLGDIIDQVRRSKS